MSMLKSYLFLAGRAIHKMDWNHVGVTIPEIHHALTEEYDPPSFSMPKKQPLIDLMRLENAVHQGVAKGKLVSDDGILYHLGGLVPKDEVHASPNLTPMNSFEADDGKLWVVDENSL